MKKKATINILGFFLLFFFLFFFLWIYALFDLGYIPKNRLGRS